LGVDKGAEQAFDSVGTPGYRETNDFEEDDMRRIWVPAMLVVGLIIGGAANVTARQSHSTPFRGTIHTVAPGENLWEIVQEAYPGQDPREGISRVRKANKLDSRSIRPGQRLRLPSR
jgi:hypothetical protein